MGGIRMDHSLKFCGVFWRAGFLPGTIPGHSGEYKANTEEALISPTTAVWFGPERQSDDPVRLGIFPTWSGDGGGLRLPVGERDACAIAAGRRVCGSFSAERRKHAGAAHWTGRPFRLVAPLRICFSIPVPFWTFLDFTFSGQTRQRSCWPDEFERTYTVRHSRNTGIAVELALLFERD